MLLAVEGIRHAALSRQSRFDGSEFDRRHQRNRGLTNFARETWSCIRWVSAAAHQDDVISFANVLTG